MDTPGPVLLVDGHSILFRAHYAFFRNPLINSKGMNTSAVFGFMNMILPVIQEGDYAYVVVAFDRSSQTFRNELYPEYKGNRDECPPEIVEQTPYARQLIQAMNLPVVESDDYEADDLLGTLAKRFGSPEHPVTILTGDRDILQLVDDNISVQLTKSGIRETADFHSAADVEKVLGVPPEKVPDLKGLQGDSSDNIPGVPGVGPKTAVKLLTAHGTLEGVYEALPDMKKSKMKERLGENRELAFLSRTLGTIVTDVDLDLELATARRGDPDREKIRALTGELELRRIGQLLEADDRSEDEATRYQLVTTPEQLQEMVDALAGEEVIALDTETTGVHPMRCDLVGVSLSARDHVAWYVPLAHTAEGSETQLPWEDVRARLAPLVGEGGSARVVGQNIGYDLLVLRRHGLELGEVEFDTMLAAWVLAPAKRRYDLKSLALDELGWSMKTYTEVAGKKATFAEVPVADALGYAAADADAAAALRQVYAPRLEEAGLAGLYRDLEMPLVRVLADMEHRGIGVDPGVLEEIGKDLRGELEGLVTKAHELAGQEFNVKSPSQLGKILFESLGYEPIKRTKTGYSTDADVLAQLEAYQGCELAGVVHRHRHLAKLLGTYVDTLPKEIHPETGRIHASFHLTGSATGRLSSSDPNLQNIPIRSPEGRRIREAFLPADGKVYVGADYSQIELRILAHMSGSAVLRKAFADGADVHRRTAAEVFEVAEDAVSAEQRDKAKAINFGLIYGQSAHGLASQLLIPRKEAQGFIDRYFARLPEVKTFLEATKEKARATGYAETMLGRRREIPELASDRRNLVAFAERVAVNTPIQGTAADLIKLAMREVDRALVAGKTGAALVLQIHDELILECPEDAAEDASALLVEKMEAAMELEVPVVASLSRGTTWAELK